MTTTTAPEFVRTVTHFADMPCVVESGDTTTADWVDVSCASCLSWMPPHVAARCQHDGIVPVSRMYGHSVPARLLPGYLWACSCGYQTRRQVENVPARWMTADVRERITAMDARIAAKASR